MAVFNVWFGYLTMFPGSPRRASSGPRPTRKTTSTSPPISITSSSRAPDTCPECWKYFASLKTAETEILQVKTYSEPSLPALPMTDGGKRTLTLGPLLPKTPAP